MLLACLTVACASPEPEAVAPAGLGEVEIPADFTFATQRAVTVEVAGDTAWDALLVEVRLPSGELVYQGPILPDAPVRLAAATAVDAFDVRVQGADLDRELRAEVTAGRAVIRL